MARQRGIQTIVDGAHALAHFPFKLSDLGCDYYGTSLHKWLSAPIGTGLLYVRRDRVPGLWPLMPAPSAMDNDIRKFEEIGTHPAAMHNAISDALEFYRLIGPERKTARLRYLRQRWSERLGNIRGVKLLTNPAPENSCAIGLVQFDGIEPQTLADESLKRHKIIVTPIVHPEFKALRVTPNVYTSEDDIDQFCSAVETLLRA
jgi:selenocysteine lyase/cysteine desulfurase